MNKFGGFLIGAIVLALFIYFRVQKFSDNNSDFAGFMLKNEIMLPGTPNRIYDAVTGDISAWWDQSFSESPRKLYIEARPGGGFYEIFDESGDGVLHATVTAAQRGRLLRFEGPLGFAGYAIDMVTTYDFEPQGADSTRLKVTVRASGEIQDGWQQVVNQAWRHFLFENLLPYVAKKERLE